MTNNPKPAVVAIVKGGVGNQCFIYAAARALALRSGRSLYLDSRCGYAHDSYGRIYKLDRFPVVAEILEESRRIAPSLKHPRHKLIRAWNKCLPRDRRTYLAEDHKLPPSQLTTLSNTRDRVTLVGYWQDEQYFADYAECIRTELIPPEPTDCHNREFGRYLAAVESVSLHIRRLRYPAALPRAYYQNAVSRARAAFDHPQFVIFGDDPQWALESLDFGDAPVEVMDRNGSDELADLWLLSRCRHAITANSSFSWWGAWLSGPPSADHHVWAPAETGLQLRSASGWDLVSNTERP